MADYGRLLMFLGIGIFITGALLTFAGRLPWLTNLPGNLTIQRENFAIYAPCGTMILVSVLLTIVLNVIARYWR